MLNTFLLFSVICKLYQNVIVVAGQDVKTWRSNTNFDNIKNWKSGQLPCFKQKIIFPDSTPLAIFMPESFSISEMILPANGELIFPQTAVLSAIDSRDENLCFGEVAEFISRTDFWYDPDNWNITSDRAFPRIVSTRNAAVPHAYQVPCLLDEAWFPEDSTFRVHVNYPSTSLSKLVISGREYDQDDFNILVRSDIGKLLFPDTPRLRITHVSCDDVTGCVCGNEAPDILPLICKFKMSCPELNCFDPIKPIGHCCSMCAAKIVAKYESHFRMDELMRLYDRYLSKDDFLQVESYTSKTSEGSIESVFVDNSHGNKKANEVAQEIHNELAADANGAHSYGIRVVEMQKSVTWTSEESKYDSLKSTGLSSGTITSIVIILLLSIGIGIILYFYKKQQIPGFSFARFDLRGDRIELELGTTPHDELEPDENHSSPALEEKNNAFDNPVYGTNVTTEVASGVEDSIEGKNFVENPMFMIFEDTVKKGSD